MTAGRKPASTVSISKNGQLRLPHDFVLHKQRVKVRWSFSEIRISLASDGEIGLMPIFATQTRSPRIDLNRIFKLMDMNPKVLAGEYPTKIVRGTLVVKLRR